MQAIYTCVSCSSETLNYTYYILVWGLDALVWVLTCLCRYLHTCVRTRHACVGTCTIVRGLCTLVWVLPAWHAECRTQCSTYIVH